MAFKSILVLLNHDKHAAARLLHATRLARQFDCHLVGLIPTGVVDLPSMAYAAASISELAALAWDALNDQAERQAEAFRSHCGASGLASFEAIIEQADKALSLVRHANLCDLAVLTQADPEDGAHAAVQHLIEAALLHSGKPTVVFPYAECPQTFGARVMVAWDGSRESARAISDALPILQLAAEVRLISWDQGGSDGLKIKQDLEAVARSLKRHGVEAQVTLDRAPEGVGGAMLSRVADWNVDLIVMGAYGHARWAQRVLGGATRSLLHTMTVPVLMSH